uniref:Cyclic nucleotide-binding domain-containing protein n=1 Tax=Quercus lobata TaxID=97700 RepID=A0A7N2MJI7_QUELO
MAVVIAEDVVVLSIEEQKCEHVANNDVEWVVDSAAPYHIIPTKGLFTTYTAGDFDLRMNVFSTLTMNQASYCNYLSNGRWKLTKGPLVVAIGHACCGMYKTHVKICKKKFNEIKDFEKTPKMSVGINGVETKRVKFSLPNSASEEEVVGDEGYEDAKATWDDDEVKDPRGLEEREQYPPLEIVVIWLVVPKLLKENRINLIMTILLVTYFVQFFANLYHSIYLLKKLQKVTGYIFGSVWWRFNLNLLAYLIAAHVGLPLSPNIVVGGCWFALSTKRLVSCLHQQCDMSTKCNLSLVCSEARCNNQHIQLASGKNLMGNQCGANITAIRSFCLDEDGPYNYGIYLQALPVLSSNSLAVKILYPVFWGLLCLSSFGNVLAPTSNVLEVIFSICITLGGLALFTTLVANIQVFLHTLMATKKNVLLKHRDMVWWMKRRQLPLHLRRRVHRFECQRWAAMEGQDEMQLIKDLPDGLRRDIKRYLCIDLVKKVPLFQILDDLILDNICDLVTPYIYGKGEKIIREGDPVQRMVFVVHGRVRRSQALNRGFIGTSMLQPGSFFGDELLSWCLRRPFIDRLPSSSATFVCAESIEAYCLDADQLRYITDHFRYQFASDRLMRTMRYYSSNWRTRAAVTIQIAWRCNKTRTKGTVSLLMHNRGTDSLLRHYAVYFMSLKPQDHLE